MPIWTQHTPSPTPLNTVGHVKLGEFIAEMVNGRIGGFGRLATPSLKTDWSKVVELLLSITCARAFQHKLTLGAANAPRGINAVACLSFATPLSLTGIWSGTGKGPPYDEIVIREDDGRPNGVSVLHFLLEPTSER